MTVDTCIQRLERLTVVVAGAEQPSMGPQDADLALVMDRALDLGFTPIGANWFAPPAPAAPRSSRSTRRAAIADAVAAPQARRRSFASR